MSDYLDPLRAAPFEESLPDGPVDELIRAIADRQRGVIHHWQLQRIGVDDDAILYRVKVGRLRRVARGVYTVGHGTMDVHATRLRALLTYTDDAFLSHLSAGAHWDMTYDSPTTTHVTVGHRRGLARRDGITLHRPRTLRPTDVTVHEGLPVTTANRTIVDVAASQPVRVTERAIEQAEILHLFDLHAIQALERRRVPGARQALALLDTMTEDQRTEVRSTLEEQFLQLSRRHGIELPRFNERVHGWSVDAHWPTRRVIVELDSRAFHLNDIAFERDRDATNRLQMEGWIVLRFTYRQVRDEPHTVLAIVERALRPANMVAA